MSQRRVAMVSALLLAATTLGVPTVASAGATAALPAVFAGAVTAAPSPATRVTVEVPVALDATHATPASVSYRTVNGTAKAGVNFIAAHGTVMFAASTDVQVDVKVVLLTATVPPAGLTFKVVLSGAHGATIVGAVGLVQLLATPWMVAHAGASAPSGPLVTVGDVVVLSGATGRSGPRLVPITLSSCDARGCGARRHRERHGEGRHGLRPQRRRRRRCAPAPWPRRSR